MKKILSRILPLCLCAALLIPLAACRGLAVKPFRAENFIPWFANVREQSPGHLALDTQYNDAAFEEVVAFYEEALAAMEAQQTALDETSALWDYRGTYGKDKKIEVTITPVEDYVYIFVAFLDEMSY